MEFLDYKIVEQKRKEKKKKYVNVITGMYAGEELINFGEETIFNDICLYIPSRFRIMGAEAKKKYPSDSRPQIIMTNENNDINLTFSLFEQTIQKEELERTIDDFHLMISAIQPYNLFYEKGTLCTNGINSRWMDFKSYAFTGEMYNLLTVFAINHQMLIAMFNCPFSMVQQWKTIMLEIIKSVRESK